MNFQRIKDDLKYVILNHMINRFPSWEVRRFILTKLGMKIGKGARIGIGCIIIHPEKISIGDRTIINEYCHIDGKGELVIGCDSSISIYSKIITASHKMTTNKFEYYEKKTIIGDNVWIGCNATVLDGSTLNDECVIGAGAVFKGIAEHGGVYLGVPAVLKKYRNLEDKYEICYKAYFR